MNLRDANGLALIGDIGMYSYFLFLCIQSLENNQGLSCQCRRIKGKGNVDASLFGFCGKGFACGKEVTAEKTFVAEEADGSIILEFTFDSSALAGKKIVAFEDVTYEGISIGTHEDLTDEDQTISYPEIHTTAADQASGSKTMTLGSSVTLVDTVTYKGLTAGKTYVVGNHYG